MEFVKKKMQESERQKRKKITYLETVINVLCATLGEAQIQQIDFIKDFGLQKNGDKNKVDILLHK